MRSYVDAHIGLHMHACDSCNSHEDPWRQCDSTEILAPVNLGIINRGMALLLELLMSEYAVIITVLLPVYNGTYSGLQLHNNHASTPLV